MAPAPPSPALPASHPLASELNSLRQQISQYRAAAHQASIDVQGVRLELELAKERAAGFETRNTALQAEVDTLRGTPDPPVAAQPSSQLAELSLAHRRLSAKLDFTEQQLAASSLELAAARQELQRSQKEREHERAQLNELRRVEDDREEEIEWERGERKRIEEQKRLCDLALAEYAALVSRLDPKAVPPPIPRRISDNILQVQPVLGSAPPVPAKDKEAKDDKAAAEDKKEEDTKDVKDEPEGYSVDKPKEDHHVEIDIMGDSDAESEAGDAKEEIKADDAKPATKDIEADDTKMAAKDIEADDVATPIAAAPASKLPIATESTSSTDSISRSSDAISNLLIGQRGVHRLFQDFSATVAAKDKQINSLQIHADEMEHAMGVLKEQLESETAVRVEAQSERDRVLRDDASAAKVVERYMTFSQKAHQTVHMHLGQLRERSASTQASLRAETSAAKQRLRGEMDRSTRLRAAAEEMAIELGRESAGRRREVALRLQLIAADEARARRAESWLDRVRRTREGLDTAAAAALVDEAVEILAPTEKVQEVKKSWRPRVFSRRKSEAPSPEPVDKVEEESLARIFLAEELVQHLVNDLQIETERRMELERQRVAWLADEAEAGVPAGTGSGGLVFDMDDDDKAENKSKDDEDDKAADKTEAEQSANADETDGTADKPADKADDKPDDKAGKQGKGKKGKKGKAAKDAGKEDKEGKDNATADKPQENDTASQAASDENSPAKSPALAELSAIFDPLGERYEPLQKSLHDQSVSLANLRTSIPEPGQPSALNPNKRTGLRALVRSSRTAHDDLVALLDSLHEVIEDARVDTEIAVADEDRVFHGFAELLGVGASGVVQAPSVLRDATAYAAARSGEDTPFERLSARVNDIENDLAVIKITLHEQEGMEVTYQEEPPVKGGKRKSVWATLPLRTVTPTRPAPSLGLSAVAALGPESDSDDDVKPPTRVSLFSSMGRSFTMGVTGAASGVAGGGRKVSDFAGGLYRPRGKSVSEGSPVEAEGKDEGKAAKGVKEAKEAADDDVE